MRSARSRSSAPIPPIAWTSRWRPAPPPFSISRRTASSSSGIRAGVRRCGEFERRLDQVPDRPSGRRSREARPRRRSAPPERRLVEDLGGRSGARVGQRGVAREAVDQGDHRPSSSSDVWASSARISTVPGAGGAQLPPEPRVVRNVCGAAEDRAGRAEVVEVAHRSRHAGARPAAHRELADRGQALSRPWRNGELAPSACSIGRCRRRPLNARIAVSASGMPTSTCSPPVGWATASPRRSETARSVPCR